MEECNLKNSNICQLSKETFGITSNIKEAGYILEDGTMLDFSGRYSAQGYKRDNFHFIPTDSDYLKNQRNSDHREISKLYKGEEEPTDAMIRFMKECKAIRVVSGKDELDIDFIKKVSEKQKNILKNFEGKTVFIDIDDLNGRVVCSKKFDNFNLKEFDEFTNSCQSKIHPKGHIVIPNK